MQQQELMDRADKAESEKIGLEKKLLEASQEIHSVKEDLCNEKERREKVSFLIKNCNQQHIGLYQILFLHSFNFFLLRL